MAKLNIFIASRTEEENRILERRINELRSELGPFSFVGLHPAGLPLAAAESPALVILNIHEWVKREADSLAALREAGYAGPVLVLTKTNVPATGDNTSFLRKPYDVPTLVGLVRSMLLARVVRQQVHKRFTTSQEAEVESPIGTKIQSRVVNLSKGGACLEFITPSPLKTGDQVKVKLELKDLNRTYTVHAKVVWVGEESNRGSGFGIEFIGPAHMKAELRGY